MCFNTNKTHISFKTPKPATVSAAINRREDNTILERKGHKDKYDQRSRPRS